MERVGLLAGGQTSWTQGEAGRERGRIWTWGTKTHGIHWQTWLWDAGKLGERLECTTRHKYCRSSMIGRRKERRATYICRNAETQKHRHTSENIESTNTKPKLGKERHSRAAALINVRGKNFTGEEQLRLEVDPMSICQSNQFVTITKAALPNKTCICVSMLNLLEYNFLGSLLAPGKTCWHLTFAPHQCPHMWVYRSSVSAFSWFYKRHLVNVHNVLAPC